MPVTFADWLGDRSISELEALARKRAAQKKLAARK